MPASNAASVQARVVSSATPPENVSHEPREISETSRSEEPSLRYLMHCSLRSALGGGRCSVSEDVRHEQQRAERVPDAEGEADQAQRGRGGADAADERAACERAT